jgi:integrase
MSVERVVRQGGVVWRVRWREGGRNRSKVLGRKRDAEHFDAEVKRRQRVGDLALVDAGTQTLADFAEEWWSLYAAPNLAPKTRRVYASLWDLHVLPRVGGLRLRELRPESVNRLIADLHEQGLAPGTVRKVVALLQGVLQRAVEWGRIPQNPARLARKPSAKRSREVRPLSPRTIEAIRQHMLREGRPRDATLVSVLAYAGLRPGEALALTWGHVRERTISVDCAASMGAVRKTKTGRSRTVRLVAPLAHDLLAWRLTCGRPDDGELVFPGKRGGPLTEGQWNRWQEGIYRQSATAAGVERPRAYDLRHSFVSVLIHEGVSILEVARQAGHTPTVALNTYGHVFDEFEPAERTTAEAQIRRARDELVPVSYLDVASSEA